MADSAARRSQRRRSRNPLASFAQNRKHGVMIEVGEVTPTLKRVRIACDDLAGWTFTPGTHIRIEINDPLSWYGILRPGETLRTYSVWEFDAEEPTVEIRGHLYGGDGIGLRWLRDVKPGDPIPFWGPLGDLALRPEVGYHLFLGEETAAVAFGPLLGALGAGQRVDGVLESDTVLDEVPVPCAHRLRRVHRDGASAVASSVLLDALADLELPDEVGWAYIAGEARTSQALRQHLVRQRNWPGSRITVKPFWTPGKRGLHH